MTKKGKWKRVGSVGIDSGLLWLGDPCYCVATDCSERPAETWSEFCEELSKKEEESGIQGVAQWNYKLGHPGLGVTVGTGYGDGYYPVEVRLNEDGRVAEIRVKFT